MPEEDRRPIEGRLNGTEPHGWLRLTKESIAHWRTQWRGTQPRILECEACHLSSRVGIPKEAPDTEQQSAPRHSVSYGGSSASGTRPSTATRTAQDADTSGVTRAMGPELAQGVIQRSSSDDNGDDVAMEGENADEKSAEGTRTHQDRTAEGGSRHRENHGRQGMSNQPVPVSTSRGGCQGRRPRRAIR